MRIIPIKNKRTNKPMTDAEVIRSLDKIFKKLDSGTIEDKALLSKITNGENEIVEYIDRLAKIDNDEELERVKEKTLTPINIKK